MRLTIETVRDEPTSFAPNGLYFVFNGDVDSNHSFSGSADDLATAFDMVKECLKDQYDYRASLNSKN